MDQHIGSREEFDMPCLVAGRFARPFGDYIQLAAFRREYRQ